MRELSLHVLDAMQNSVEAGASRIALTIDEDLEQDRLVIEITDNGRGMKPEMVAKVLDPFVTTRTTRKVGLGLPLFAAAARRCEGDFKIESEPGRGTRVVATFRRGNIDRAPLGDISGTLLAVLLAERPVEVSYTHKVGAETFCFDSAAVREALGGVALSHPKVRQYLSLMLHEGEAGLKEAG